MDQETRQMRMKDRASATDRSLDIVDFHRRFGLVYEGPPRALPPILQSFRTGFLEEELKEYKEAVEALQLETNEERRKVLAADAFDALLDLMYVAEGTLYLHGFDTDEGWRRVHRANMKKVRAHPSGVDSKRGSSFDVVKPEGWEAPDHSDLVKNLRPFGG